MRHTEQTTSMKSVLDFNSVADLLRMDVLMKRILVLLTVLVCLISVKVVVGQDVDVDDLVYMTEEYRPYNYTENGQLKGISIELLQLIWTHMGFQKQPIQIYPWARGYNLLKENENHVLFATTRTEEREHLFKWVGPLYSAKFILIALAKNPIEIDTLESAKEYQVGTIQEDVSEQLLVAAGFGKNVLQPVSRIEQNIQKLQKGRIDLIAYSERSFKSAIQVGKINPDQFKTVLVVKEINSYFAFNKSVTDTLIKKFQQALDSLQSEHQVILDKYFN